MALILIVDDEYLVASMLADMLVEEGHEVVIAPNGRAALEKVRERRPSLVITDFMMPLMTGLEFAEAVLADAEITGIPIILMSGAQGSIARERPELFHAIIDKPFRNEDILKKIAKILA